MEEVWRDIPKYEGYYQASNLGRVKSLPRKAFNGKVWHPIKGKVLKQGMSTSVYPQIMLYINGVRNSISVHQLVAFAFLDHKPDTTGLVVDHIDGNRKNNNLSNLRVVSHWDNLSICHRARENSFSSKYLGVTKTGKNSWSVSIQHNGIPCKIGTFKDEYEGHLVYMMARDEIKNGTFNADEYKERYKQKYTSKYKGVHVNKYKTWVAKITLNSKEYYLGSFKTELLAHQAYIQAKSEIANGTFLQLREQENKTA